MQQSIIRFVVRAAFASVLLFGFNSLAFAQVAPPDLPQPFVMVGTTEGDGIHFTITDSQYLNVTLDSSEQIKLKMDSVPEMVTLMVEPSASSTATSTQVTLSGFTPATTYYKYEDSYHNLDQFITDVDGKYSYTQDLSKSHIVFIQPRHSTKFIKDDAMGGDCTAIGVWDNATKVCTMNTDLTETIQIDSDGVTLDGNGHTLTGYNTGNGIYLNGRTGVAIKNLNIAGFTYGVYFNSSEGNILEDNIVSGTSNYGTGISLTYSNSNNIIGNSVLSNSWSSGISLYSSNSNTLTGNTTSSSNGNVGMYILSSSNNTLTNNTVSGTFYCGIILSSSAGNTLTSNTVSTLLNNDNGILLSYSDNNTLNNNSVLGNSNGITLANSNNNTLTNNNVSGNFMGFRLYSSNSNTITSNTVSNNLYAGIFVYGCDNNIITNNNVTGSSVYGIYLSSNPSANQIYNNNFINNVTQVYVENYTVSDVFNLAAPIGGNYWSDFDTTGEGCSDASNDGFCDTPYVFNGGQDNLPWTKKDGWLAPVTPVKNINVAIVLVEPLDVAHGDFVPENKPCKLEKFATTTYASYDKNYYTDLAYCINDYYKEVSHGSLSFTFKVFDKEGQWYKTTKTEASYGIGDREDEFVKDAVALSVQDVSASGSVFDVVAVVHAGESEQRSQNLSLMNTLSWTPFGLLFGQAPYKLIIAEQDPVGFWVHELAHNVGVILDPAGTMTPDLYKMGNVGQWDLMAAGEWNGGANNDDGTNPSYLSSYTQEFLGWLKEDVHSKAEYGTHWINSLETSNFGDTIFRYNLEDNIATTTQQYYILEARNKNLSTWDSSLPEDKALVLYRVDASGSPEEYGYDSESIRNQKRRITIPAGTLGINDGILSPAGEGYLDLDNWVRISANEEENVDGKYKILASIQDISPGSFLNKMKGSILRPQNDLYDSIQTNVVGVSHNFTAGAIFTTNLITYFIKDTAPTPVFFLILSLIALVLYKKKDLKNNTKHKVSKFLVKLLWVTTALVWLVYLVFILRIFLGEVRYIPKDFDTTCGSFRTKENPDPCKNKRNVVPASSLFNSISPDLDLHAITPDGKHVGVNYVTGEYENQISGSIVSGDNQGIPEWIYVPEGTQVKYYVSAHDNDEFLKQNPQIASQMATTTDSYSLYARTIDPAVGIFTSPILENQTIAPTEEKTYLINTAGADVSVQESNDLTAPVTTATPVGTLGLNEYYTSQVTVTLIADDVASLGEVSSGVAITKYSLDNGTTWNTYSTSTPLVIATEGTTTIQYYSVDNNENSETPKTLVLNIDTVAPTIFASDTSTEQLTANGTLLTIPVTVSDSIDANPTFTTDAPLTQTFAPGVTNILITAQDMAGNIATSSIAVTIYSSPEADPDGDGVPNQDDVKPFDATVFANLTIPTEYALWEKESFDLPFSVAGKGNVLLTLSNTYYQVGANPVKDNAGTIVPAAVTTADGVISITFLQDTKELRNYTFTIATKKGNSKERKSLKDKWDNELDEEKRHDLDKEFKFASAPITLAIINTTANISTSQTSSVTIYDKTQSAQLQYKYKDTEHSTSLLLKSDDTIKLKKGQPLVLTVKMSGAKRDTPFTANISGNFTTLNVVQEEEHSDGDDRKQTKFSLFFPQSLTTTQENITIVTTVNGITQTDVVEVRFEE
ncbi:MAG: right-handed parallel beta-helix repeat-containing protein [Candidatus Pacebacteria bacterium]|jgi:M6 family metalloprotease-like protein|nr:right-handed parallel beta-helix repeat-containing protein [Candidatus Paceibacterota bacterium]